MSKWTEVKQAIKNPPPERLAYIEYRSHFLNMIGVTIVSIVLVLKGFWYIIFAFIFMVGVSYSQGMSAYAKYKMIQGLITPLSIKEERSPTRMRSRINQEVLGSKIHWLAFFMAFGMAGLIINPLNPDFIWYHSIAYGLLVFLFWGLLYFLVFYWISLPIYKSRMKGGNDNAKSKKRRND